MSLEDSINNLAAAINALANACADRSTVINTPSTFSTLPEQMAAITGAQTESKRRGRPPGTTNKPKEDPAPTPEPVVEDPTPPAEEPEVETTIDDLRKALMALRDHDKGNKTRAVKAMRDISGFEAVPDVAPQFYAAIVAKCKELMA